MSIKLAIAGRPPIDVHEPEITLGSDPACTVSFPEFPDVKPKHAVIHAIAGRWVIEVREGKSIVIGGAESIRPHWLTPGDEFRLSKDGPAIIFEPTADKIAPSDDQFVLLDDEVAPPVDEIEFTVRGVKLPLDDAPLVLAESPPPVPSTSKKAPSSGSIPTRKPGSSSTIPISDSEDLSDTAKSGQSRETTRSSVSSSTHSSDEPVVNVPKLQRMSFDDVLVDEVEGDEDDIGFKKRSKLSSDQQELRWVLIVVARCVGAGLAIVFVWLTIAWIWRAFSPATIEPVNVSYEYERGSRESAAIVCASGPEQSPRRTANKNKFVAMAICASLRNNGIGDR